MWQTTLQNKLYYFSEKLMVMCILKVGYFAPSKSCLAEPKPYEVISRTKSSSVLVSRKKQLT